MTSPSEAATKEGRWGTGEVAEDEVCKAGQGTMCGAMNGRWNRLDILREE